MYAFASHKDVDSRDFLLVASNQSLYTDLLIARSTGNQSSEKSDVSSFFTRQIRRFFQGK